MANIRFQPNKCCKDLFCDGQCTDRIDLDSTITYSLQISGFTDCTKSCCSAWNGTFVLERYTPGVGGTYPCSWYYDFEEGTECETDFRYFLNITTSLVEVRLIMLDVGVYCQWKNSVSGPIDCSFDSYNVAYDSGQTCGGSYCDGTSTTCTVTQVIS